MGCLSLSFQLLSTPRSEKPSPPAVRPRRSKPSWRGSALRPPLPSTAVLPARCLIGESRRLLQHSRPGRVLFTQAAAHLVAAGHERLLAVPGLGSLVMKTTQSSSWPDLQPELLGLVLKRLPILTDRVRLRAVCWPWRSNARLQALPPLNPCLILRDGSFLSIPGGEIIRMPEQYDGRCCGIIDNWLFLVKSDGGCSLVDPFSKATVDLPKIPMGPCDPYQYKLVVSSPLDSSPDSPVAVMFLDDGGYTTIGIRQPPIAFNFYRGKFLDHFHALIDVTFFDGKFYGLDFGDKLLTFEVSYTYGLGSKPKISSVKNVINSMDNIPDLPNPKPLPERAYVASRYLVECCGRLLMVRQWLVIPLTLEHARTASFEVFEADLSTKPNQWRRVQNLGGQALFVGGRRSKSFPAGEGNGIQEDCIYFMCDYFPSHFAANPLGDSGVYNITDGMITPLFSETATVPRRQLGQWRLTWYFPADAV